MTKKQKNTRFVAGEVVEVEFGKRCYDGCPNYMERRPTIIRGRLSSLPLNGTCKATKKNVYGCFECTAITKDSLESRPAGSLCGVMLENTLYDGELRKHDAFDVYLLPILKKSNKIERPSGRSRGQGNPFACA